MCIHEFYISNACGHVFPKVEPSSRPNVFFDDPERTIPVPQSLTCTPVKLALKFYHDQVVYLPADMNCGSKVEIPRSCPVVHTPRNGISPKAIEEQQKADSRLRTIMLHNGLGPVQEWQIEMNAATLEQCSNRAKPGAHHPAELRRHKQREYPLNMYAHVQAVKAYQARDRRHMLPNVNYFRTTDGCGGPFFAECLKGWKGENLLAQRLHLWGDLITHPKPCNHQCLTGWSGADLDASRQQTWAGENPNHWIGIDYANFAPSHLFKQSRDWTRWVVLEYNGMSNIHADQSLWKGEPKRVERREILPHEQDVSVPEKVLVPVPERLSQVLGMLYKMSQEPPPSDDGQASIENLLGRLPQAFNEEGLQIGEWLVGAEDASAGEGLAGEDPDAAEDSGSESTALGGPEEQSEREQPQPAPVETPEMAEARGQRARAVLREKIARDFPSGAGKAAVREESGSEES